MTAQLRSGHIGLPPPTAWDLIDGDRIVGWATEKTVGFRGFADEAEAAHAAWVAYRTVARRLARTRGARPIPIGTERLTVQRREDHEVVLAAGRPIARLVRPGGDSRSGPESVGFEIEIPEPADELRVRAMAHLVYRTLRKSGLRWALWRPSDTRVVARTATKRVEDRALERRSTPAPSGAAVVAIVALVAIAIGTVVTLVAAAPPTVTFPLAVALAGGIVATILVATGDTWLAGRTRRRRVALARAATSRARERTTEVTA